MGTGSASAFTYSATQPIGLELIGATSVPQISHWGSSVIMEGEYDEDRAYVYTIGTKTWCKNCCWCYQGSTSN